MAAWALSASALDRQGAIDAAKQQVKSRCTGATLCTFTADTQEGKWHVRVDFAKGGGENEKPQPAGHAIFIIDQSGRIVGRVEGK